MSGSSRSSQWSRTCSFWEREGARGPSVVTDSRLRARRGAAAFVTRPAEYESRGSLDRAPGSGLVGVASGSGAHLGLGASRQAVLEGGASSGLQTERSRRRDRHEVIDVGDGGDDDDDGLGGVPALVS
jgi:hypothetical protein